MILLWHLGKPREPRARAGGWEHKHTGSSAGHSLRVIRKSNTNHHLREKTPAQALPATQKESKTHTSCPTEATVHPGRLRRGEIPGEPVCGLGLSASALFFVQQPSAKPQRKQNELTGFSSPLGPLVLQAGADRRCLFCREGSSTNHVLLSLG